MKCQCLSQKDKVLRHMLSLRTTLILAFTLWRASELHADAVHTFSLTVKLSQPHFSPGSTTAGIMHKIQNHLSSYCKVTCQFLERCYPELRPKFITGENTKGVVMRNRIHIKEAIPKVMTKPTISMQVAPKPLQIPRITDVYMIGGKTFSPQSSQLRHLV